MDLYWGGVAPIDLDRSSRECRRGVTPFALHLQRSVGRERVAYVEVLRSVGDPHRASSGLGFRKSLGHSDRDILTVVADDVVFEREAFLVDIRRKIRHRYDPKIPAQV